MLLHKLPLQQNIKQWKAFYTPQVQSYLGWVAGGFVGWRFNVWRMEYPNKYVLWAKEDKLEMPEYPPKLRLFSNILLVGLGGFFGSAVGPSFFIPAAAAAYVVANVGMLSAQYNSDCEEQYNKQKMH